MKEKYLFGKLGSKIKYLYIDNETISIKDGGTALLSDKFLTNEEIINKKDITNIEIARPMLKPGYMIITTSSGKNIQFEISTVKQYKNALFIKQNLF